MLKSLIATLLIIFSVFLHGCSNDLSGLQSYDNPIEGYKFLYPNGWIPMDLKQTSQGVNLVLRDLIQKTENISVIVNKISGSKTLEDLGTASEVGYRFMKNVNQNDNLDRKAELIRSESREANGKNYYILEYEVELPDSNTRHDLASVAVSRGKLFTFNISTPGNVWEKQKNKFELVVKSFSVD